MKKMFVILMALVIMVMMTGCNVFTEKAEIYSYDENGNRILIPTEIYHYDSEGNLTAHYVLVDS